MIGYGGGEGGFSEGFAGVFDQILRERRKEAGALQLASPEVKFEIDTETHDPLDVGMYQVLACMQLPLACMCQRLTCMQFDGHISYRLLCSKHVTCTQIV